MVTADTRGVVTAGTGGVVTAVSPSIVDRAFLMFVLNIVAENERDVEQDVERGVDGVIVRVEVVKSTGAGDAERGVAGDAERGVAGDSMETDAGRGVEGGVEDGTHFTPPVRTLFFNLLENI